MNKSEIIKKIDKNHELLELGSSQSDIVKYCIEDYFNKFENPKEKSLKEYLIKNCDTMELGSSQLDLLLDVIFE